MYDTYYQRRVCEEGEDRSHPLLIAVLPMECFLTQNKKYGSYDMISNFDGIILVGSHLFLLLRVVSFIGSVFGCNANMLGVSIAFVSRYY